jgi:hypothetical protein
VLVTGADLNQENYTVTVGSGVTSTCTGLPASGSARLLLQIYLAGIKLNNVWQYNDSGTDLQYEWLANAYVDTTGVAGWLSGVAVFDGKTPQPPGRTTVGGETVATQLNLTNAAFPSTTAVIPSYYFRKHFTLNAERENVSLRFRSMFDDYGVIYLNGQEAYRDTNIVATNYPFSRYIELGPTIGTVAWSQFKPFPTTNLFKGDNVLAVYLKQATVGSSDVTMGLELIATITNVCCPPRIMVVDNGTTITIYSTLAGSTLWYSSDLTNWTQGTTAFPQTFNKSDAQCRFFQLR